MNKYFSLFFPLLIATAACSSDDDPTPPTDQVGNASKGSGYQELYDCKETNFAIFAPLVSDRYDPEQGGLLEAPLESYIIHTTQLFVKPEKEFDFIAMSGNISAQLAQTEGLIAFSLAGDDGCGDNRTLGIWESEEAMFAFAGSGAHAEAMTTTLDVSFTGRTMAWEATAEEVNALTWDVAKEKIAEVEESGLYELRN